jgi:hypothetical protein
MLTSLPLSIHSVHRCFSPPPPPPPNSRCMSPAIDLNLLSPPEAASLALEDLAKIYLRPDFASLKPEQRMPGASLAFKLRFARPVTNFVLGKELWTCLPNINENSVLSSNRDDEERGACASPLLDEDEFEIDYEDDIGSISPDFFQAEAQSPVRNEPMIASAENIQLPKELDEFIIMDVFALATGVNAIREVTLETVKEGHAYTATIRGSCHGALSLERICTSLTEFSKSFPPGDKYKLTVENDASLRIENSFSIICKLTK